MATRKTHDLAVKTGEYTNAQGEKKGRYQNVGAVMQGDNGQFIMLAKWFNPAGVVDARGGESIILSMFEPRQEGQQQPAQRPAAPAPQDRPRYQPPAPRNDDFEGDVPF
jgi:hypothetical protein